MLVQSQTRTERVQSFPIRFTKIVMKMLFILLFVLKLTLSLSLALFMLFVVSVLSFRFIIEPVKKGKCTCKTKLHGKVALITGGNSGIGFETAKDLARRGAKVIIASRDVIKSENAVNEIKSSTGNNEVQYKFLDLSKFECVREFVSEFLKENNRLDILVNNSGVSGIKNRLTEDGINKVIQVNYVAPFLLTNLLRDILIESAPSRIVILSSCLHRWAALDTNDIAGRNITGSLLPYNNSKLCNILWAKALAKKLPKEVIVNALHPGAVKTNIFNKVTGWRHKLLMLTLDLLFKNAKEGAQTVIHLCVSPHVTTSGDYYVDCKKYKHANEAMDDDIVEKVYGESMKLINKYV